MIRMVCGPVAVKSAFPQRLKPRPFKASGLTQRVYGSQAGLSVSAQASRASHRLEQDTSAVASPRATASSTKAPPKSGMCHSGSTRVLQADPRSEPTSAPVAPNAAPPRGLSPSEIDNAAPQTPPESNLQSSEAGLSRLGSKGVLSLTNSPSASLRVMCPARLESSSERGELPRESRPLLAAQLTAAGAVMERRPATNPIPRARRDDVRFAIRVSFQPPAFSCQFKTKCSYGMNLAPNRAVSVTTDG
jgi:hypothetical protein